ncbi:hypothetical protein CONLIGDRAFT_666507 [Coniochaeta ligniaria NRRL 30616]|uniref:F-box domain-containing protein n=1 Tax=Coniochaeta ligniaria NRRL 30616 TaxID=1408157 RepID=A0A1J7JT38_9PEZI|nr:hypothetical protein CONLIGDRAFT_666507 [Coniochaeta ligniaria NRRL 30616]
MNRLWAPVNWLTSLAKGTTATNEPTTGIMANVAGLNDDIWYLVLDNLDALEDLSNMCLVSKNLYPLAIARLYRTLVLGPRPISFREYLNSLADGSCDEKKERETQWDDSRALIRRLMGDRNREQARAVREVEVVAFQQGEEEFSFEFKQKDGLAALVNALPNLRQFRLLSSKPDFEHLIRALNDHPNRPELHLLGETGSRVVTGSMPCVATLRARVNPYFDRVDEPNRKILGLQGLFFACTNLKSFSLEEHGNYGGCVRRTPHHRGVYSFQLTGEETFPPLESLSLDGYFIELEEWTHWRNKIDWSNLKSLRLGPQPNTDLVKRFTGHAKFLRNLTVQTWAGEGRDSCPRLESFLMSFDTLEQLVVRGHFLSIQALSNHPRLKHLCLHTVELKRNGAPRPILDVADLSTLDANCPDLETLEIDISRDSSGWPEDITRSLASGFTNLRQLTLHCEVGIDWAAQGRERKPLLPILDVDLAKTFGQSFFALRPQSKLETLTLKAGEKLRRFPQWSPAYANDERKWSLIAHIRAPSSPDGELKVNIEPMYDLL